MRPLWSGHGKMPQICVCAHRRLTSLARDNPPQHTRQHRREGGAPFARGEPQGKQHERPVACRAGRYGSDSHHDGVHARALAEAVSKQWSIRRNGWRTIRLHTRREPRESRVLVLEVRLRGGGDTRGHQIKNKANQYTITLPLERRRWNFSNWVNMTKMHG